MAGDWNRWAPAPRRRLHDRIGISEHVDLDDDPAVAPASATPLVTPLPGYRERNIHGLTSLLVARPTMPWPELDAFVDEHLALCMQAHRRR